MQHSSLLSFPFFGNDNTYYKSKIGVINILEKRGDKDKDKSEDILLPI
jgi:hypothetical protein